MNADQTPRTIKASSEAAKRGTPFPLLDECEKLERELAQAQQQNERLKASIKGALGCGQVVGQSKKILNETLQTLSQSPGETMVPWSVVQEYMNALNPAIQQKFIIGTSVGDVIKRFEAAEYKLQSYAPKKGQP